MRGGHRPEDHLRWVNPKETLDSNGRRMGRGLFRRLSGKALENEMRSMFVEGRFAKQRGSCIPQER